jgi:hypothetical protein
MMYFKTILLSMFSFLSVNQINDINDLKWNNRVLIIAYSHSIDFSKKINAMIEEFDERNFIIVHIKDKNTFIDNTKMSKSFSDSILKKIKSINKKQFLILLGKDGHVKNTYPEGTQIEKIFSDVDKMPMRKYEIELKNNHSK